MLVNLAKMFGLGIAEKVAVSVCVLVFFWGVFLLVCVATRRRPWYLVPLLGMLTYGYVFYMGFMNFYLSIGLACVALASLWEGTKRGMRIALVLAPLILLAHPLGFIWLLGTGLYRLLWRRMKGRMEWILPVAAFGVGLVVRWYLMHHPELQPDWPERPFYQWNGLDQFWIFRPETRYLGMTVLLFALLATALDLFPWKRSDISWKERRLFPELYLVSFCLTSLLPEDLRPNENAGWIGVLVTRLTLVSAIFAICWLGTLRPRLWHLVVLFVCACVYFAFNYTDTGLISRMEENAQNITRNLPFGTRVLGVSSLPGEYRTGALHIIDRACIGHCFLYSNYEPSTRQFRVRVTEGSPVAVASVDDSEDMQFGSYDVQDDDLPLQQIYQCDPRDWTKLCIRELKAGEKNGLGVMKPE
jgi:branched-subunit amino acid ABC-type transport system permease component